MTNKEFYGDKLLAIALEDLCHKMLTAFYDKERCAEKKCEDCKFYNIERIENWLNAEHKEPPLLENGDGLKSGDWIMVRNDNEESWTSQVFLCFVYGYFICVCDKEYIGHDGNYKLWKQARLPEGDE